MKKMEGNPLFLYSGSQNLEIAASDLGPYAQAVDSQGGSQDGTNNDIRVLLCYLCHNRASGPSGRDMDGNLLQDAVQR